MYFGSVRFFKHLIITVCILIMIIPTVLCIILLADNSGKAAEIERLNSLISAPQESKDDESRTEESGESTESRLSITELFTNCYVNSYSGSYESAENTVYITVDGKIDESTAMLLDSLDETGAKLTFFVTPDDSELCKKTLERMISSGHTVAVYSGSEDLQSIYSSAENYLKDFSQAFDTIFRATGKKPVLLRFPGGSISEANREISLEITSEMTRRGFSYFDWNIDGDNWLNADRSQIFRDASDIAYSYSSPVIRFSSDGSQEKCELIKYVISVMNENGYKMAALTQKNEPVHFR